MIKRPSYLARFWRTNIPGHGNRNVFKCPGLLLCVDHIIGSEVVIPSTTAHINNVINYYASLISRVLGTTVERIRTNDVISISPVYEEMTNLVKTITSDMRLPHEERAVLAKYLTTSVVLTERAEDEVLMITHAKARGLPIDKQHKIQLNAFCRRLLKTGLESNKYAIAHEKVKRKR